MLRSWLRNRRPATKWWNIARGAVGIGFLGSALGNLVFTLRDPEPIFDFFVEGVTLPFFDNLMESVIAPNPELFVAITVGYEAVTGTLVLDRGRRVDLGLIGVLGFLVFLLPYNQPFLPYGLSTAMLLAVIGPLLFRRYETSLWRALKRRVQRETRSGD